MKKNNDQSKVLGIDVGGTTIKAAFVDIHNGQLISKKVSVNTPNPAIPKSIFSKLEKKEDAGKSIMSYVSDILKENEEIEIAGFLNDIQETKESIKAKAIYGDKTYPCELQLDKISDSFSQFMCRNMDRKFKIVKKSGRAKNVKLTSDMVRRSSPMLYLRAIKFFNLFIKGISFARPTIKTTCITTT